MRLRSPVSSAGAFEARLSDRPSVPACLNCGIAVAGSYCGEYGQPIRTHRMRFPVLFRDFFAGALSFDHKAVRTCGVLVTRPGPFVRSYLLGRRIPYLSPLSYYLLVVALNVAATVVLGHAAVTPVRHDLGDSFWDENFVALQISAAFTVLMLPLAGAQRLLQRGARYSLAEHYAFLLCVLAQSVLVVLAVQLVLRVVGRDLTGGAEGLTWLAAFSAYLLWAGHGFFAEALQWRVMKVLGAYGIVLVEFAALGVAIGSIVSVL